jgi:hypothetical protein
MASPDQLPLPSFSSCYLDDASVLRMDRLYYSPKAGADPAPAGSAPAHEATKGIFDCRLPIKNPQLQSDNRHMINR